MRLTVPSLTATDLCISTGGGSIDRALLARAATLAELEDALTAIPRRRGNVGRRRWLLDSRGNPWSAAERLSHQLLRAAGIDGWVGNLRVRRRAGGNYYVDIAFPQRRLAIEIESDRFHGDPAQRRRDRIRQNELALLGWTVLRVDWWMLHDDPDGFIALVLQFLDQ